MSLVAQTFLAVLDTLHANEGLWYSTVELSLGQVAEALGQARPTFAEWDPERGLYYVDFSPVDSDLATVDFLLVDLKGSRGVDHLRLEWAQGPVLSGVEFQTHAPGPLPLLAEIAPWIGGDPFDRSPALTLEAWSVYLEELVPQPPVL
jgi:hypothetical protein